MAVWTTAALLLTFPFVATQLSEEVKWDVADFVLFGSLLVGAGLVFEIAVRKSGSNAYRAAVGVALAAAFLLVCVNAGVGVIGSEDNDANLMYFGVLAVGILGAIIGRFQSQAMARTMFATAVAQVLVGVIALSAGLGSAAPIWPWDVLGLTGFFTAMWVGSGRLFRNSLREPRTAADAR